MIGLFRLASCLWICLLSSSPARIRDSTIQRNALRGVLVHQKLLGSCAGRRRVIEKLWREFFCDPSQWWDHRSEKVNMRYPDFKHKKTNEALWLVDNCNPPWVESELATMAPGSLQLNIFSWNRKLTKSIQAREYGKTVQLFQQMQLDGITPNQFTFVPVLNACSKLQALEQGRSIHLQIMQMGHESDVFVGSCLVDFYAKCGDIEQAWLVFSKMPVRDVVSWTAMILGWVKCGGGQRALDLFRQMNGQGVEPNSVTFVAVLNACASLVALEEGRLIHEQIVQNGYESDVFVGSTLVDMYAKCGSIEDAWRVFKSMPARDVVSWNAMIMGFVKSEQGQRALELYQQMYEEGVEPNSLTFVGVLNACTSLVAFREGQHIHEEIMRRGYGTDVFVCNCLIDLYAKCGSIVYAWEVFTEMRVRDVVSWTAMIMAYVKYGQGQNALELFRQMQEEGVHPNPVTFVGVVNACGCVASLEEGRHVHEQIIRSGFDHDVFVSSSLVDMYSKCGSIEDAWKVFNNMPRHDVVSWSAMIMAYVNCGQEQKALETFRDMQKEGVDPDTVTFLGVLNACASLAALEEGRRVHEQIIQRGYESDLYVGNSLVDMYSKCGSLEDARGVFRKMPKQDVAAWNSMLGAYAMHGHVEEALSHFGHMSQESIRMDAVTFLCLLSACNHAGLVDEGLHYFDSMSAEYSISTTVDHYTCIVDLLGRAGRLHEAEDLIKGMVSFNPNACIWMSLLGACRLHGNVEMGELVAKPVVGLDPGNAAGYLLLSNIYAAAGKWDTSRTIKHYRGLKNMLGGSSIHVNKEVHSFIVDAEEHPQIVEIRHELESLSSQMEAAGYVPDTRFLLSNVEKEIKSCHLSHRTENWPRWWNA